MTARTTEETYLPDDIWECIFKFLDDDDNNTLKSLSVVSKQFLSITNRLRFSLTITSQSIPFLSTLLHRFSNLTSLSLSSERRNDTGVNELLTLISTFPNLSTIKSLFLSVYDNNITADGLRALSKKMTNLTSFTCYGMSYIRKKDLFFIADCFPLLEELYLSCFHICLESRDHHDQLLALPKLREIYLFGTHLTHQYIVDLCKNCELLRVISVIPRFFSSIYFGHAKQK
jgi:F-box/leucine-rich repeat protein 2/20